MIKVEIHGDVPMYEIMMPAIPQQYDRMYILGRNYEVSQINYIFKDCIFDYVSITLRMV
jgi:hypothetical protein